MNAILDSFKTSLTEAGAPEEVITLLTTYFFAVMLASAVALVVFAFWGFKIFRVCLPLGGAIAFGAVGNLLIAPLVTGAIGGEALYLGSFGIDIAAAIGVVCAILGAVIMGVFFKFALFLLGAGTGYVVGANVFYMIGNGATEGFFASNVAFYIVAAVAALIVAILFVLLFKYIYIFVTSVGGLAEVGAIIALTLMVDIIPVVLYAAMAVGAIVGIFAMVYQIRHANGND